MTPAGTPPSPAARGGSAPGPTTPADRDGQRPKPPPPPAFSSLAPGQPSWPGRRIVEASWVGTIAFLATAGVATVWAPADLVALVLALGMFAAGSVAFSIAFLVAVRRSRTEEIVVPSLFFLQGSAPAPVRRLLFAALAAEVVGAFVTAGVRPNTSLAFGILAPMYGLGLIGLWAARHGTFPARVRAADTRRRPPVSPGTGPGYHRSSESD